jgi:hypothetical protein
MDGQSKDLSEAITKAIYSSIARLNDETTKLSVGDLTKLLELQKELQKEEVREVKVTWTESDPIPPPSIEP